MKKESLIYVFRLLLLGLVLFVSAFQKGAANPLDNRWQPLSYQDGVGIFFDTATIRFTDGNEEQISFGSDAHLTPPPPMNSLTC